MPLLKNIIGGVVKGISTVVKNARVGRDAKAAGFIQPTAQGQQDAFIRANVATSQNQLLMLFGGLVVFIGIIFAIFKK